MPKQILFIKAIKPPQANPVAPLVEKMKGLIEELASATGVGAGDGTDGMDGDEDDQASIAANAEGDSTTDPAAGGNTDDGQPGANPKIPTAADDGADGGDGSGNDNDGETPGANGEDATDPAAGGAQYGAHNVEPGHHIAFQAGDFKGAGKVTAVGEDGATAQDQKGRDHRIHWHEITGHNDAAADAGAKPTAKPATKPKPKPGAEDGQAA